MSDMMIDHLGAKVHKVPDHIKERVGIAIGQASMCWSEPFTRDCVFDTEEATKVGAQLCQFIMDEIDKAGGCP